VSSAPSRERRRRSRTAPHDEHRQSTGPRQPEHDRHRHRAEEGVVDQRDHPEDGRPCDQQHRGQVLRGLSHAIDQQLDAWNLTPAEKEVAFLLLKGLSFKEVAPVRKASERTVRQQALAVYAKSGPAGGAELAAFFLEDLLVPATKDPGAA
jgi:DNA-binding CsgD family transcriptional regulator